MPKYTITAKRETLYEFNIEADSEEEAIEQVLEDDFTLCDEATDCSLTLEGYLEELEADP